MNLIERFSPRTIAPAATATAPTAMAMAISKTLVVGAVAAGAALTALGSATPAGAAPRTAAGAAGRTAAGTAAGAAAGTAARILWVKAGAGCTDAGSGTRARPLCTVARAAAAARPGTVVLIRAGRYGVLAPRVSGTPRAPISFTAAERGVVLAAGGRPAAVNVNRVHDLRFAGLTVTGAARQGVWVGSSARISFTALTVR